MISRRIYGLFCLSFALLVIAGGSSSQAATAKATVYMGLTGSDLQQILQDAGYRAELTQDGVTAENIEYVLGVYSDALVFFMDHFDFTPA
ncbi:MAG: hypothetical protein ACR2QQ_06710 [Gammaproteobacteria bacterium]